jgi:hypothetical protein
MIFGFATSVNSVSDTPFGSNGTLVGGRQENLLFSLFWSDTVGVPSFMHIVRLTALMENLLHCVIAPLICPFLPPGKYGRLILKDRFFNVSLGAVVSSGTKLLS